MALRRSLSQRSPRLWMDTSSRYLSNALPQLFPMTMPLSAPRRISVSRSDAQAAASAFVLNVVDSRVPRMAIYARQTPNCFLNEAMRSSRCGTIMASIWRNRYFIFVGFNLD